MPDDSLKGDLRERVDGGFEGWCWAPDRPEQRLVVDLLVNDTVAASIVAASFRRDLLLRGIGDGRHGFTLRLPPNLPETDGEHIVTARERASGAVVGRVLRGTGAAIPGSDRLDGVTEAMDELWRRLDAARGAGAPVSAAERLRDALGVLAGRLAARSAAHRGRGDIAPGVPTHDRPVLLPEIAEPELSIVLRAADGTATLRRLAALAPAADLARAELIVVDPGQDPYAALLPAQVRNLRYVRAPAATIAAAANVAAPLAGGTRLLLLGETPAEPSAAALLALGRAADGVAPALLLGPTATAALAAAGEPQMQTVRLHGRLGVVLCVDRAVWQDLGPLDPVLHDGAGLEYADLALRARMLGCRLVAVAEPAAADPAAAQPAAGVAPAEARRALAAFNLRWGAPALDPARRTA